MKRRGGERFWFAIAALRFTQPYISAMVAISCSNFITDFADGLTVSIRVQSTVIFTD